VRRLVLARTEISLKVFAPAADFRRKAASGVLGVKLATKSARRRDFAVVSVVVVVVVVAN